MLVHFYKNEQSTVSKFALDAPSEQNIGDCSVLLSSVIPLLVVNSNSLADRLHNYMIDCAKLYRKTGTDTDTNTTFDVIFAEQPTRYGYLLLYINSELKFAIYCSEITIAMAVKSILRVNLPASRIVFHDFVLKAKLNTIITQQEPFLSELTNFLNAGCSLALASYTYINISGTVIKCSRVGKAGRDLCVVEKTTLNSKIADLNKALTKPAQGLLSIASFTAGLQNLKKEPAVLNLITLKLPVSRLLCATPLSELKNEADIIVALASMREDEAPCVHVSASWLKNAAKHKLNKLPSKITSNGRFEVQRLTAEASIKYSGLCWKGADKSDLIYVISDITTKQIKACISIGAHELNYIVEYIKEIDARFENKEYIYDITFDFKNNDMTPLITQSGFSKSVYTINHMTNSEADTVLKLINAKFVNNSHDLSQKFTRPLYTIEFSKFTLRPRSFNFPKITIIKLGETYEGFLKYNYTLMKNVNDTADKFILDLTPMLDIKLDGSKNIISSDFRPKYAYNHNIATAFTAFARDYHFSDMLLCSGMLKDYRGNVKDYHCEVNNILGYAGNSMHIIYTQKYMAVTKAIYGKRIESLFNATYEAYTGFRSFLPIWIDFSPAETTVIYKILNILVATGQLVGDASISSSSLSPQEFAKYAQIVASDLQLGYICDTYEEYLGLVDLQYKFDTLISNTIEIAAPTTISIDDVDDEDIEIDDVDMDEDEDESDSEISDEDTIIDDDILDEEAAADAMLEDVDLDDDDLLDQLDDELLSSYDENTEIGDDIELSDDIEIDESGFEDDEVIDKVSLNSDESSNWKMYRQMWLQSHPNSANVTINGEVVYWFDAAHIITMEDQPAISNNIAVLETIWKGMLENMPDVNSESLIQMIYDSVNGADGEGAASDIDTTRDDSVPPISTDSLVDDNDALFSGL